jgi:hypothetical protein
MAEEVFGFNSGDTDALLRMIGKTPQPLGPTETDDATRLVLAYTTGGATARSGTTLGKGTATMRYLAVSGTDRVLTATTDTAAVTFYNLATSVVGINRYIMLLRFGDVLVCNWEECN